MIERPDSVSRVMAPITAMAKIMAATPSNQMPSARVEAGAFVENWTRETMVIS
ncbi:MAG: hypothetical protein Kilf2KO_07290 [Rhodospirillales bacterium]